MHASCTRPGFRGIRQLERRYKSRATHHGTCISASLPQSSKACTPTHRECASCQLHRRTSFCSWTNVSSVVGVQSGAYRPRVVSPMRWRPPRASCYNVDSFLVNKNVPGLSTPHVYVDQHVGPRRRCKQRACFSGRTAVQPQLRASGRNGCGRPSASRPMAAFLGHGLRVNCPGGRFEFRRSGWGVLGSMRLRCSCRGVVCRLPPTTAALLRADTPLLRQCGRVELVRKCPTVSTTAHACDMRLWPRAAIPTPNWAIGQARGSSYAPRGDDVRASEERQGRESGLVSLQKNVCLCRPCGNYTFHVPADKSCYVYGDVDRVVGCLRLRCAWAWLTLSGSRPPGL